MWPASHREPELSGSELQANGAARLSGTARRVPESPSRSGYSPESLDRRAAAGHELPPAGKKRDPVRVRRKGWRLRYRFRFVFRHSGAKGQRPEGMSVAPFRVDLEIFARLKGQFHDASITPVALGYSPGPSLRSSTRS